MGQILIQNLKTKTNYLITKNRFRPKATSSIFVKNQNLKNLKKITHSNHVLTLKTQSEASMKATRQTT